jgi:hypothetical protein
MKKQLALLVFATFPALALAFALAAPPVQEGYAARPERKVLRREKGSPSPYQSAIAAQVIVTNTTQRENEVKDLVSSIQYYVEKNIKGIIQTPEGEVRLAIGSDVLGLGEVLPQLDIGEVGKKDEKTNPNNSKLIFESVHGHTIYIRIFGKNELVPVALEQFFRD